MTNKTQASVCVSDAECALAREILEEAATALRYLAENREQLLRDVPEQWIALRTVSVLKAHGSHASLLDDLRSEGIDPARLTITFITSETPRLRLVQG